ncbi:MAG: hypothetical protein GX616_06125 [Planctomycetes bacterium]|nr:hypothetical protein [Planctomycetota bacterium]
MLIGNSLGQLIQAPTAAEPNEIELAEWDGSSPAVVMFFKYPVVIVENTPDPWIVIVDSQPYSWMALSVEYLGGDARLVRINLDPASVDPSWMYIYYEFGDEFGQTTVIQSPEHPFNRHWTGGIQV